MNKLRHCLALCVLLAGMAVPVLAQDSENRGAQTAPGAEPLEKPQAATQTAEPAAETPAAREQSPPAKAAGQIREFTPTDKIQADSAVSFPIDI